jgi:hypothetical protein|tara:strand:- start:93 stop:878 length:786 start_codon:yes stop_codon:yes gene_type:complete
MSTNYNDCYPGMQVADEACYRFTDKSIQESERFLYSNWWREEINQFGVKVKYFVNTFNALSANNIYGEEPTKVFAPPREIIIAATLNENAITLSQFGFQSDDDITAYIHISSFHDQFYTLSAVWETQYNIVEPKAGDIFQLSEYGNDRPNNRQAKYFEITEKLDEDVAQINNLAGHYVFLIKAKRLDYSFEPNIPFNNLTSNISGNSQIYEDTFAGRLAGGENPESQPKRDGYDESNADNTSKTDVFDMSVNDTDVYGDYY